MTPTASKATTLLKIHYTYENTYTDENRKKNNIEIVFAVLLILLPARKGGIWLWRWLRRCGCVAHDATS
jgi:hypothetical protein